MHERLRKYLKTLLKGQKKPNPSPEFSNQHPQENMIREISEQHGLKTYRCSYDGESVQNLPEPLRKYWITKEEFYKGKASKQDLINAGDAALEAM